ncbi:MAG TPA: ATP-binding domain-containing protein [Jatrophihabitantaceae bacterium]|nr:ATP-binding domain-containing protein [Jatrophihabitantaceae bacterium]
MPLIPGRTAIATHDVSPDTNVAAELAMEQAHISRLYNLLDDLRERTAAELKRAMNSQTAGTPAAVSEREAFVRLYSGRVAQLQAVESRLCFGRLDMLGGARRYIGRLGISDEQRSELLVDWRAPAAEPFYQATAAHPQDVIRRRQLSTAKRQVTGVQDEVLDLDEFEAGGVDGSRVVVGEGALFASLDAARSGRMRDIVATIQADQDRAIRAPLAGVFVVQGGPGTGKTAVALHRTAFLLYANRAQIERSGVLLVGPNRVFLRYIEQVLPALGEADAVLMVTPGQLYPGVSTDLQDEPELAALKGDPRMATVIAEAVRRRERTLDRSRRLDVDGTVITLDPKEVRDAREHARRSGLRHNQARAGFVAELLRALLRKLARAREVHLDVEARENLMADLHESVDVRREINWCWAPISPERLLRDLFADTGGTTHLEQAGRRLTSAERASLRRPRTAPWTVADVALLDEAAELLGPDDAGSNVSGARADAARRAEIAYAEQVQDTFGGGGFITAEDLAGRYTSTSLTGNVAERAAGDREWAFGHVVVDEAQELSPMFWRLLMRRCPAKSMTLVGDTAQTGSLAGARSWREVLRPHVEDRWNVAELTVNYRTPGQIMDVAAAVVRAAELPVAVPASARPGDHPPEFTRVAGAGTTSSELAGVVATEWQRAAPGTVVVITSRAGHRQAAEAIAAALPDGVVTTDTAALGSPVSVLTVADAKGLEFDTVVLVEPASIVAESPRGINDLYVALTRPTQRLHVVHAGPLPPGMAT